VKLAIVGSRDVTDYNLVKSEVLKRFDINEVDIIVSGGANGVDSLAEQLAKEFNKKMKVFPAKWDDLSHPDARIRTNKYGKKYDANAGHRRNQQIVDFADSVIAFRLNNSSGTTDTIKRTEKAGKHLITIDL